MPSNKRAPAPPAGRSLYDLFGDEGGPRGATSHHYRLSGPSCISLSGDWYALMEARTRRRFSKNFTFAELRAIALVPPSQLTGRAKALAEDLGDDEGRVCACTD